MKTTPAGSGKRSNGEYPSPSPIPKVPEPPRFTDALAPVQLRAPQPMAVSSRIHFMVHPGMEEIRRVAESHRWFDRGFSQLTIPWQELVYTTDGWRSCRTLKSTDVPSPIVNGYFTLPDVPKGTLVEFAIHVGIDCHSPDDHASYRERGDVWLNNGGSNYTQVSQ
jgi:hypothetical protein